jgi:hypothetical protein
MVERSEFQDAVKDLVSENGRPIVLSRYGWKIEEIDGKKYLMAMNEAENQSMAKDLGMDAKRLSGSCVIDDYARCFKSSCTGSCALTTIGGRWVCVCNG